MIELFGITFFNMQSSFVPAPHWEFEFDNAALKRLSSRTSADQLPTGFNIAPYWDETVLDLLYFCILVFSNVHNVGLKSYRGATKVPSGCRGHTRGHRQSDSFFAK